MKKNVIIALVSLCIVCFGILIINLYNRLDISVKYYIPFKIARSLLQDDYSKEVFDCAVMLWQKHPLHLREKYQTPLRDKYYEEFENPNVKVEKGDTVMEVGVAGALFVAKKLLNYTGETGKLLVVEPNPAIIDTIRYGLREYNNVKIYVLGLYNANVTKTLYTFPEWENDKMQSKSTIKKEWQSYHEYDLPEAKPITVDLVKLDYLVKSRSIEKIDYIRMNIEGAELEALQGARRTLQKQKPKLCIVLEHHPSQLFSIILYLKSLHAGYKFWLGFHKEHPYRFVLYAK